MIHDTSIAKGRVSFCLTGEDGQVKQQFEKDNLIVNVGHNFMANALIASSTSPFTYMAIGTSGTAPALADTTLGAELTRVAFTSAVQASNIVTFVGTYAPGVGTGALQEAGIFNASSSGTMLSHVTYSVINKGAADSLTITWVVTCN